MIDILLHGCCGRMGRAITAIVSSRSDCRIAAGIDITGNKLSDYPVYKSTADVPADEKFDVVVDFSTASAVKGVLDFCLERSIPAVIATTGITPEVKTYMAKVSEKIAVLNSANMSIGVCLIRELAKKASLFLGEDFDVEIVEKHHNKKLDAPSGTALAIADSINSVNDGKYTYVYDRQSRHEARGKNELGISSIRGGNIVGDHEVIFAGSNEVIEISHSAFSRELFADGAVKAAVFLAGKPAGKYEISDMIQF